MEGELPPGLEQERFGIEPHLLPIVELRQHSRRCVFEHAIQASQHRERQDDFAIVGLLVVPAQQVGDGPDEGRQIGFSHVLCCLQEQHRSASRVILGPERLKIGQMMIPSTQRAMNHPQHSNAEHREAH